VAANVPGVGVAAHFDFFGRWQECLILVFLYASKNQLGGFFFF
jgi:hypothetical protein